MYRPSSTLNEVLAGEERPASTGNNRATLQRYGKMLNGQTPKIATSDYDQRHVIAFRPISAAARSWSCADWSKRGHVTLVIIGRCTLERLTVQHFSIALQCCMCNIFP